jgi:hypothetical protein
MDQNEQAYKNGYNAALRELAEQLKKYACFYDLDNYHSFEAVAIEVIDDIANELIKE